MTLRMRMRMRLGNALSGLEMSSIWFTSQLPCNWLRILVLRLWGAKIGADVAVQRGLRVRAARRLSIGDHVYIADHVWMDALGGIEIQDHVSINADVQIWSGTHDWRSPGFETVLSAIRIEDHAWICSRSSVLPGVVIGRGAVLGAGSTASRSLPPMTLSVGVPARVVATRPGPLAYDISARLAKPWFW